AGPYSRLKSQLMKPLSIIALAGVALAGAWHLQAQAGAATIEPRDPVLAIFREAKAAARGAPSPGRKWRPVRRAKRQTILRRCSRGFMRGERYRQMTRCRT